MTLTKTRLSNHVFEWSSMILARSCATSMRSSLTIENNFMTLTKSHLTLCILNLRVRRLLMESFHPSEELKVLDNVLF